MTPQEIKDALEGGLTAGELEHVAGQANDVRLAAWAARSARVRADLDLARKEGS